MNKEDFLSRIREENEGNDPYENEVSRFSWKIGAIVISALGLLFFYLEWFFYGHCNYGMVCVITTLLAVSYSIKAIKLRRGSDIAFAVFWSVLALLLIVIYILVLVNGWF